MIESVAYFMNQIPYDLVRLITFVVKTEFSCGWWLIKKRARVASICTHNSLKKNLKKIAYIYIYYILPVCKYTKFLVCRFFARSYLLAPLTSFHISYFVAVDFGFACVRVLMPREFLLNFFVGRVGHRTTEHRKKTIIELLSL